MSHDAAHLKPAEVPLLSMLFLTFLKCCTWFYSSSFPWRPWQSRRQHSKSGSFPQTRTPAGILLKLHSFQICSSHSSDLCFLLVQVCGVRLFKGMQSWRCQLSQAVCCSSEGSSKAWQLFQSTFCFFDIPNATADSCHFSEKD